MRAVAAIAGLVLKEIFRKKDFYVAFFLAGLILFWAQSLHFYNVKNVSRYLAEIGLALIFFFSVVLSAALAARQYPSEVANRTLALILSKPVSRAQLVLGKYLGAAVSSLAAFTLFFAVFLGVLWWKAGSVDWAVAAQTWYLFALNLAVFSAMAGFFSYTLTVSANVTISLTVYYLISLYGSGLRESAARMAPGAREALELLYFALPHFEFFDLRQRFVHGWEGISPDLLGFLGLYAFCYTAFFLLVSYHRIRKRAL